MNKLIIYLVLLSVSTALMAQDTIIKQDKTEIKSKVLEITPIAIKYKKWEKQDGPTYNIDTKEVLMIIYADGEKEYFDNSGIKTPITQEQSSDTELTEESNEEKIKSWKYLNLFLDFDGFRTVDVRDDLNPGEIKQVTLWSMGLSFIHPLKIKGKPHSNVMIGPQLWISTLGNGHVSMLTSYNLGYGHNFSDQLSILGTLKPTLSYISFDVPSQSFQGDFETETLTDFVLLLGFKGRYFFSESGKFGVSSELVISTESGGGASFLVGAIMRFNSKK